MARQFINMYQDNSDFSGYYIVEYIDENGEIKKDSFETDLAAQEFYNQIILERNTPQSQ